MKSLAKIPERDEYKIGGRFVFKLSQDETLNGENLDSAWYQAMLKLKSVVHKMGKTNIRSIPEFMESATGRKVIEAAFVNTKIEIKLFISKQRMVEIIGQMDKHIKKSEDKDKSGVKAKSGVCTWLQKLSSLTIDLLKDVKEQINIKELRWTLRT